MKRAVFAAAAMLNAACASAQMPQARLDHPSTTDWVTFHGDYSGRHFSALDQIDHRSVKRLALLWTSELDDGSRPQDAQPAASNGIGSGSSDWYFDAIKATPLIFGGRIYYTLGAYAFALDAATGRQLWRHEVSGCRPSPFGSRGMAAYDGALFLICDHALVSIRQADGNQLWRQEISGHLATSAPLTVRGHVLIAIGSDGGTGRGWLEAHDARTGARQWVWYATPKAGDPELATWPSEHAAEAGAGTPWQTPSYDPDLNLLYVSTGNAYPVMDGKARHGDNLWTSSIVALDPDSGTLRWYFQLMPHETHDYDGNQVVALFDRKEAGTSGKLLAIAARGGYFYLLDRVTGRGIRTTKFLPTANWGRPRDNHSVEQVPEKEPAATGVLVSPGSDGATNFPAPSYSPRTNRMYVNSVESWSLYYGDGTVGGREYMLGDFRSALRAIDTRTGRVAWQHDYPGRGFFAAYPGVLSTGGGLVFAGDPAGNLIAFDERSGSILWHHELPAPVSNVPQTFAVGGKQIILSGSGKHLYAFSLQ